MSDPLASGVRWAFLLAFLSPTCISLVLTLTAG
jgi:hypothetical protein